MRHSSRVDRFAVCGLLKLRKRLRCDWPLACPCIVLHPEHEGGHIGIPGHSIHTVLHPIFVPVWSPPEPQGARMHIKHPKVRTREVKSDTERERSRGKERGKRRERQREPPVWCWCTHGNQRCAAPNMARTGVVSCPVSQCAAGTCCGLSAGTTHTCRRPRRAPQ